VKLAPEQQRRAKDAIGTGYITACFAFEHWELFAAWAKAKTGDDWANDGPQVVYDAQILYLMSEIDE
jgi:hypothetical protein